MSDRWTARLSDYVNGEVSSAEREALEAHLAECEACARTLDELRSVVAAAASLEDRVPERDLWPGIESRLEPRPAAVIALPTARRGRVFSLPQLIAAGLAGMVLAGAGAWAALGGGPAPQRLATEVVPAAEAAAVHYVISDYQAAVGDLEAALERHREELDPATVQVVEDNLRIIDRAIEDARAALEADPASPYLNAHLAAAMRRKVDLLRRATSLSTL